MSIPKKLSYVTAAEYLEGERGAEIRHEYVDGEVCALAGATIRHHRLEQRPENADCEVFIVDTKD